MKFTRIPRIIFLLTLLFLAGKSGFSQMRQIYSDVVNTSNDIRKLSFYSPTSGYVASTEASDDWIGFTSDSGRTFIKRYITLGNVNYNGYNVNLTFGFGIQGVKAFSQDTLIVYGDYGLVPAILYSTNGGVSYILIFHSQAGTYFHEVYDMVFPQNNNIGYAVDGFRILKTIDKGQSWSVSAIDYSAPFDALDGIDNSNVFAFSRNENGNYTGKLIKTTNAGSSWQLVTLPDPHIYSVDFITASKGWANLYLNGDSMLVYYTSNGGGSWIKKNNGTATPVLFNKMQFLNDSTGFAISDLYTTFKTSDSGRIWEPILRDNNFSYLYYGHNDLQVMNNNQFWSGGARDLLEINTTGGEPRLPRAFFNIDTTGVNATNIVKLVNFSRTVHQSDWYVNGIYLNSNYNTTYTHDLSRSSDTIKLIVTNGTRTDSLVRIQYFIVPNLPVVTSFEPTSGSIGTYVLIRGTAFTGVTAVKFGGTNASSFTILNDTTITATVAGGATGIVTVTDIHGTYGLPGFTWYPPPSSPAPIVTSFTPALGPIGTSVTITGQNFGNGGGNNIVHFGIALANIISATPTQIICNVPSSTTYGPVSVLNTTTNLRGYSSKPFTVTFADSSNFAANSFVNVFNFEFDNFTYPKYVAASDLDGDGKPDVVLTKSLGGDSLNVFRNVSPGSTISFAPPQSIERIGVFSGAKFAVGDVDSDGKPDIACSTNEFSVLLFRNLSTPGQLQFAPKLSVLTDPGSQDVVIDDLDGDGRPELVVGCFNTSTVDVLRNTSVPSHPSFAQKLVMAAGGNIYICATGDLDGDGKKEVLSLGYVNTTTSTLSYFKNQSTPGTLQFDPKIDISLAGSALNGHGIFFADLDGDGKQDLVVVNDNNYFFFRNTSTPGNISLAAPITTPVPGFAYPGVVDNLSGDIKPDFMFAPHIDRYFTLVRNLSTQGSILTDPGVNIEGPYPNNIFTHWASAADFNGDGKIDIVASGTDDHKVSIYRNTLGLPISFSGGFLICEGSTAFRSSDLTGSSYQWQHNTGSGFVNISDNSTFSGTQTLSITINNTPLAFNGTLFRCVVNGNYYSSIFRLDVSTAQPPSITISTPNTTVCAGSLISFTANASNTSSFTQYVWKVNGTNVGTNSSVYTTNTIGNGDQVTCVLVNP